ncbi:hypothetical protein F5I97DRAFT_1912341 [Phlebopus sp. FC_14]|nr:hypothetical protein F5I97DRAFT_1912341 [Phlebopus sp. FC_14]
MLHNTDKSRHSESWSLIHPTFVPTSKLHNRRYSLIFGPDGQAILVGSGTDPPVSLTLNQQPPQTIPTSQIPLPSVTGLHTVFQMSSASASVPLSATSLASLTNTITSPAPTALSSSSEPLSPETTSASLIDSSTDSAAPTGLSVSATPTPTPTPRHNDYGVPFYVAIVLGLFCAVACILGLMLWWKRSRPRSRQFRELHDPWEWSESGEQSEREPSINYDRIDVDTQTRNDVERAVDTHDPNAVDTHAHNGADARSRSTHTSNGNDADTHSRSDTESRRTDADPHAMERPRHPQPPSYHLPASIVHCSITEPFLLLPLSDERALHDCISRDGLGQGPYPSLPPLRSQVHLHSNNSSTNTVTSSQISGFRPQVERFPTEISVQESTRTLGTLHVANMMPGDVTSGDEGMNRGEDDVENVRLTPTDEEESIGRTASTGNPNAGFVGHGRYAHIPLDRHRPISVPVVDDPPNLATVPWGRRTSASAGLRRTPGGASNISLGTRASAAYGGNWGQMPPSGSALALKSRQGQTECEDNRTQSSAAPQGWTDTLRSGFRHALDVVAGSRTPADAGRGNESRIASAHPSREPDPRPTSVLGLAGQHGLYPVREIAEGPITPGVAHHPNDRVWWSTDPSQSTLQSSQTRSILQGSYGHSQRMLQLSDSQPPLLDPPNNMRTWQAESQAFLVRNNAPMGSSSTLPVSYTHSITVLGRNASETTTRPRSALASTMSVYSTDSGATSVTSRNFRYERSTRSGAGFFHKAGDVLQPQPRVRTWSTLNSRSNTGTSYSSTSQSAAQQSESSTAHSENSILHAESVPGPSERSTVQEQHATPRNTAITRKKGVVTRRKRTSARPPPIRRVSSTASSILSLEGSSATLSAAEAAEAAARKALLERRKKLEVALNVERHETLSRSAK